MNGAKILVIDDSLTARMKIAETLGREGAQVTLAKSGEEGSEMALQILPDIILLDVVLPDCDGIELCKSWRTKDVLSEIPILLISGQRPESDDRTAGLRAGARGYIIKPFKDAEMLAQVNLLWELRKTHQKLQEQVKVADAANKSKSTFLATISHEIRTPLTAIMGFAETLLEPELSEQLRLEAVNIILRNGDHLLEVINDLLDFSKIEAGCLDIELRSCSVFHVLSTVSTLLRGKAAERGLILKVSNKTPLPETITTDPTRVKQILFNLIGNAIKFSGNGEIEVEVECDPLSGMILFSVTDCGIGMSEADRQLLFRPFTQADSSISRRFGGTGLGLSISKQLVEALGGSILVTSTPGEGSTFSFTIETGSLEGVSMLNAPPVERENVLKYTAAENLPRLEGRVLLVEDGEDNQRLIMFYLSTFGLDVILVDNGQDAINSALALPFNLVLMDMHLPGVDGLAATVAIRRTGCEVPIVALTADIMDRGAAPIRDAGFTDYLHKPFRRDELYDCVRKYARATAEEERSIEPILSTFFEDNKSIFTESEKLSQTILERFVTGLPDRIAEIEEALSRRDWATSTMCSHRLIGAGLFGYSSLSEMARSLEQAVIAHAFDQSCDLIVELKFLTDRICAGQRLALIH